MQKLPDEERRIVSGVSMKPEAWRLVESHADKKGTSLSNVIEELCLKLKDI